MHQLEMVLAQLQGQCISLQINLELVYLQSKANIISSSVFDICAKELNSVDEMLHEKVSENIEIEYMKLCDKRIKTVFSYTENILDVVPEEYAEDTEVTDKYDALINAEMNYVYSLCKENLGIAFNDFEYLNHLSSEVQENKIAIFTAREEMDKIMMQKVFESQKNKIITPASIPQNGLLDLSNLRTS